MENEENRDAKRAELEEIQSKYRLEFAKSVKKAEDLINKHIPPAFGKFKLSGRMLGAVMQSFGWLEVDENEDQ